VTARITKTGGRAHLTIVLNGLKGGKVERNGETVVQTVRRIASTVVDAIADVVVTDCKSHYIETSLKLPIEDEISRHAFIQALAAFDSAIDKTIAKSLIKLTPDFLLDSFYQFMTDDLKTRWQEVCVLANENAGYLVCGNTFRELLRFLISNLECREREVHLFERAEGMEILSGGLKPFNNIYINEDLPRDVQTVSKLITIAPKKIYLHQDKTAGQPELKTDSPLLSFIQNIFGSCVHVVQN
jgi:hypothetical protein